MRADNTRTEELNAALKNGCLFLLILILPVYLLAVCGFISFAIRSTYADAPVVVCDLDDLESEQAIADVLAENEIPYHTEAISEDGPFATRFFYVRPSDVHHARLILQKLADDTGLEFTVTEKSYFQDNE